MSFAHAIAGFPSCMSCCYVRVHFLTLVWVLLVPIGFKSQEATEREQQPFHDEHLGSVRVKLPVERVLHPVDQLRIRRLNVVSEPLCKVPNRFNRQALERRDSQGINGTQQPTSSKKVCVCLPWSSA